MDFHFDAVFYYVSNLDRSIMFYRDVLGFALLSQDVVARFDVDHVLFELVPGADAAKFVGQGNARLCLRVHNMEEAIRDLTRKGVRADKPETKPGGILCTFRDPDGNEICLWQYATNTK
jgi:catechol 2,3-dioxygenase-like lactoylglutathione lyase family enzyme